MRTLQHFAAVGLLTAGWLLNGCTHTHNVVKPHSLLAPTVAAKMPLAVELRLDQPYRNARWSMTYMGSTTAIPLGPQLVTNTVECAQSVFQTVTVTTAGTNGAAEPLASRAAAVLIPRLVYVDVSGNWMKDPITMALEWTLLDSSRRLVWVDSYRAEIREPVEGVKGAKNILQRRFDTVLEDLFKQSRDTMLNSVEIRRFSQSAQP